MLFIVYNFLKDFAHYKLKIVFADMLFINHQTYLEEDENM